MKKTTIYAISTLGILTILLGVFAHATPANAAGGGEALEIGPPVFNLTANPGETVIANISIRDISSTSQVVRGVVNDFTASGEDGTPDIITDLSLPQTAYSLRSWITPPASLTLIPHQIVTLPVHIVVPANATPGAHFGIVRFTATPPGIDTSGVSLAASLGALILLRVNGTVHEAVSVTEFSANNGGNAKVLFQSAPITFLDRLDDTGNAIESPTGAVVVTDMFNKPVVTLDINQPARDILPQSIREFTQSMDKTNIGNKFLFGRFHAVLTVNYGNNQTVTSSFYFWVIPYTLIGIIILILVVGFIVLRIAIIRYNRRIEERALRNRNRRR
jgi:hypothetical protein